jgi:hypothetical protein
MWHSAVREARSSSNLDAPQVDNVPMSTVSVVIQTPIADVDALNGLAVEFGSSRELLETRALDGGSVAAVVLPVTIASLSLLKAWMLARIDQKKSVKISWNGKTFQGYSAQEVSRITEALVKTLGTEGKQVDEGD